MTQTLLDNFTNFMNARLDDAEDRLALDDGYINERLKATLTPKQATLLDGILYSKCVYLADKSKRNAYCAGLGDALQLMSNILAY